MPRWRDASGPPRSFEAGALYLRPVELLAGAVAGRACRAGAAVPLAGGPLAFRRAELVARTAEGVRTWRAGLAEIRDWAEAEGGAVAARVATLAAHCTAMRPPFAGLRLDRPRLFGVLNVTPDSFSDGGDYADPETAVAHGAFLAKAGAAIVDIGGESTRPGAAPVTVEEELRRVLPVIGKVAAAGAVVSIDSRHADVMAAALDAGASVLNDVSALGHDPAALALAAKRQAPAVLMHMRGEPRTMQENPEYDDVVLDVFDYLEARMAACEGAGLRRDKLCVDPGIGFGKTAAHNLEILNKLSLFHGLGAGILVGVSRKRFLGEGRPDLAPKQRLSASIAAALGCLNQGAQCLRVHDVAESAQAIRVWAALQNGAGR
ncbi:MAG: dihydropteroate synthase [Alphaproteobacteria bacterium]|nr:dihydropteroate synthase [Alphaproteobacteria bacterium]